MPELDDALLDKLVAQSDAQAAGRSIEELAQIRDDCLVAVLRGLREQGWGAGEVVAEVERRWRAPVARRGAADGAATAPTRSGTRWSCPRSGLTTTAT